MYRCVKKIVKRKSKAEHIPGIVPALPAADVRARHVDHHLHDCVDPGLHCLLNYWLQDYLRGLELKELE